MSEDKKPFTVTDRRHFQPDGEARTSEAEAKPASRSHSDRAGTGTPGFTSGVPEDQTPPEGARPAARPGEAAAAGSARGEPRPAEVSGAAAPVLDFAGLLVFLGAQAQLLLAGQDPAGEGSAKPDLAGARGFITLLETLKQKTEGRRSPEEEQVLEGLLYQLRLEYVARSKTVGA